MKAGHDFSETVEMKALVRQETQVVSESAQEDEKLWQDKEGVISWAKIFISCHPEAWSDGMTCGTRFQYAGLLSPHFFLIGQSGLLCDVARGWKHYLELGNPVLSGWNWSIRQHDNSWNKIIRANFILEERE